MPVVAEVRLHSRSGNVTAAELSVYAKYRPDKKYCHKFRKNFPAATVPNTPVYGQTGKEHIRGQGLW